LNKNLLERITKVLKEIDITSVLEFEETYDEQFKALKELYRDSPSKNKFCVLVTLNALISYQLSGTGEQYWREFADYFKRKNINSAVSALIKFLKESRYNRRLHKAKEQRLRKLRKIEKIITNNEKEYYSNPKKLLELLSKVLGSPKTSKTLVFTVKMFNYACRIKYREIVILPNDIDIPVDLRIRKITMKLNKNADPIKLWRAVSALTGIPPLHLDSLLWITMRLIKEKKKPREVKYSKLYELLREIA